MEKYKIIDSFPDYEVSNYGRIKTRSRPIRYTHAVTNNEHFRNVESRHLKVQFNNRTGYKFCQLYLNKKMFNRTIHRLVAIAFIPNPDNLPVVNHKDGNKHNCVESNLEWCTDEYNHYHATVTGLKPKGEKVGGSKLNKNCIYAIKWFLEKGITHSELSKAFKVSRATITHIASGKTWKHIILKP